MAPTMYYDYDGQTPRFARLRLIAATEGEAFGTLVGTDKVVHSYGDQIPTALGRVTWTGVAPTDAISPTGTVYELVSVFDEGTALVDYYTAPNDNASHSFTDFPAELPGTLPSGPVSVIAADLASLTADFQALSDGLGTAATLDVGTTTGTVADGGVAAAAAAAASAAASAASAAAATANAAIPLAQKAASSGVASLDGSTKVPIAQVPTGTTSSTVALGDAPATAQANAISAASSDATTKANNAQAAAVQRANHTGTQVMATISDAGGAATKNVGTTSSTVAAGDAPATAQAAAIAAAATDATSKTAPKPAAQWATAAALAANTYANGTAGVGATLTANANGALSIDGGSPAVGDYVIVKNEGGPVNLGHLKNGLYKVTAAGSAGSQWVLTRSPATTTAASLQADTDATLRGGTWYVQKGTVNAKTGWMVSNQSAITLGTTAVTFAPVSTPRGYAWGLTSGTQSIPDSTWTTVSWPAPIVDPLGLLPGPYPATQWTFTENYLYQLVAQVGFAANFYGVRKARISQDSAVIATAEVPATGTDKQTLQVSVQPGFTDAGLAAASSKIVLQVWQNSGAALNLVTDGFQSTIWMISQINPGAV